MELNTYAKVLSVQPSFCIAKVVQGPNMGKEVFLSRKSQRSDTLDPAVTPQPKVGGIVVGRWGESREPGKRPVLYGWRVESCTKQDDATLESRPGVRPTVPAPQSPREVVDPTMRHAPGQTGDTPMLQLVPKSDTSTPHTQLASGYPGMSKYARKRAQRRAAEASSR